MPEPIPYHVGGRRERSDRQAAVIDKHTGEAFAMVCLADAQAVDRAIAAASGAAAPMRRMASFERQAALAKIAAVLKSREEEFAQVILREAGKPIAAARAEVARAIDTFQTAAGEAVRMNGELLPLDISPRAAGMSAITKRVPIGPCGFITPFNFPLNLVAHKIAPALAVGCPFVLKPAPQTPLGALMLGEMLAECGLPPGAFSIVPCEVEDAAAIVRDDRLRLLSFTGSAAVGWTLKSQAGKKKVVLELGGNAACIVDADADIVRIVPRIVFGAFYQSGQSCISVQRLLVHQDIRAKLQDSLVAAIRDIKPGDPQDPRTLLGPLISERDAIRIESWVNQAVAGGARVLCGGTRRGCVYDATLVQDVPAASPLAAEEAFGPVLTIESFASFAEAVARVNRSRYGLQAGVFSDSLRNVRHAFEELEVGGVVVNDVPSVRVDSMPYGGVKDSGLGREGVRYAMLEMTVIRTLILAGS